MPPLVSARRSLTHLSANDETELVKRVPLVPAADIPKNRCFAPQLRVQGFVALVIGADLIFALQIFDFYLQAPTRQPPQSSMDQNRNPKSPI